jgi:dienelactone hydrolase
VATNIQTDTLTLHSGGKAYQHYIAWDASSTARRPALVVFPEWWGHNDYVKRRARELAGLGFVAVAADVYGDGREAKDSTEAGTLMNGLFADMAATSQRIRDAVEALAKHPLVDGARVGAMGYCLGGAMSLHAARLGLPLRGVASFHGSLGKTHPAKPGDVKAAVLVCHGGADKLVPLDDIANFHREMSELGVDLTWISYPGAMHGYTNPEATGKGEKYGLPLRYDAATDARSWADMRAFWTRVFA